MDVLIDILYSAWRILEDSAVFILGGFVLAGLIKTFVPLKSVERSLGANGIKSVLKASVIGIPLTLCSCSVLPTAMTLRKMGASRGATSAFLISTPETGVDSISISYALLDPVMTVFRPIAAFVTAFTAGFLENALFRGEDDSLQTGESAASGCDDSCGDDCSVENKSSVSAKLIGGIRYALVDLMDDMAGWMTVGLIAAGAIETLIPGSFFHDYLGSGFIAMPVMLLIGAPMYVCATSSTPMAAAMIMKGLSPGAALVFLLAGPATNIGSLAIIKKFMGGRSLAVYLFSIAVCSILMGMGLDAFYSLMKIDPAVTMGGATNIFPEPLERASAVAFVILCARPLAARALTFARRPIS